MGEEAWQAYVQQALELHARYPVIDGHCDSILDVAGGQRPSLARPAATGHLDFPRARAGGLTAQVFALWPRPEQYADAPARRVLVLLDRLLEELAAAPDQAELVLTSAGISRARAAGRLAVILGIEGGEALEGELALLRVFYRLGVRVLGLVWDHRNALADGNLEWETGGGLSRFGRAVVREAEQLGMVIDAAHLPPAGLRDLLRHARQPVIFSHGNCRALHEHRRNLDDEQILALAAHGGVMGISFVNLFMVSDGRSTVSTVADHIDHVCQLTGSARFAALGSDYDGTLTVPAGLEEVSRLPNLTAELLRRGYRVEDLAAILGGNYLRIFDQVLREELEP